MTVVSRSDSDILAAVAGNTTTGILTVQQGSVSLTGPQFTITASFSSYSVSPQGLNMLVGETRTVSVRFSGNGGPVTGLRWITTNPGVVTLSAADPPVLTAVAPGSAIVYAGALPIFAMVQAGPSLPNGAAIWSLPLGGNELTIAPAVPSSNGADVFASGPIAPLTAISSDGKVVWTGSGVTSTIANGQAISTTSIIPDFSGGAVLKSYYSYADTNNQNHNTHIVQRVDPSTGNPTTVYTFADRADSINGGAFDDNLSVETVIPDTTGVLFVQDNASVNLFTEATGSQIGSTITLDDSIQNGVDVGPPYMGHMIVAGDGKAYLPYVYYTDVVDPPANGMVTTHRTSHLMVLRVSPDGSSAKIAVHQLPCRMVGKLST